VIDHLTIGTRGSPLALAQTKLVALALHKHHPTLNISVEIIQTTGDWQPAHGESRLDVLHGGKGLFVREIETALHDGRIDVAVHSAKDVPSVLDERSVMNHFLPRADVRDAVIFCDSLRGKLTDWQDLPAGARIGTASVRRAAYVKLRRPDIHCLPLRGNVQTRLDKIRGGDVDASFLAIAGLQRLDLAAQADQILDTDDFLPCAGQGAVGLQIRAQEDELCALLDQMSCNVTARCVQAERAALAVLGGSCHTPIGALARLDGDELSLKLCVADIADAKDYATQHQGACPDTITAQKLGQDTAHVLKARLPEDLLTRILGPQEWL